VLIVKLFPQLIHWLVEAATRELVISFGIASATLALTLLRRSDQLPQVEECYCWELGSAIYLPTPLFASDLLVVSDGDLYRDLILDGDSDLYRDLILDDDGDRFIGTGLVKLALPLSATIIAADLLRDALSREDPDGDLSLEVFFRCSSSRTM
jgi:hypothetical protein